MEAPYLYLSPELTYKITAQLITLHRFM